MEDKINSKDIINLIPLDDKTNKIAQSIIDEDDVDKLKNLTHLFNLNQAKKNVLRVLKLNNLLDKVSDEMIERFENRPGEFNNNDLLNYLQITQSAIDRANKSLNLVDETPPIQFNQLNVNVNEDTLDRESREKVKDAVQAILSKIGNITKKEDVTVSLIKEEEQDIVIEEDNVVIENKPSLLNEEE